MSEIKQYEIHLRHDDRAVFIEKLIGLLTPFPEVFASERQRCRREEVGPLMAFAEHMLANENMTFAECSVAEDLWCRCRDALAATKTAQKENPNE